MVSFPSLRLGGAVKAELLAEAKLKLNAACTAANVATREFRTFLRSADQNNQLHIQDVADAGVVIGAKNYLKVVPQFDFQYNKQLQKMRLYRTDAGGKMSLGQWDIQTSGQKLAMALGLSHNTAQELLAVGLAVNSTSGGSVVFDALNTSKVPESTNLYYTDTRVNNRITSKLQDSSITDITVSGTITYHPSM